MAILKIARMGNEILNRVAEPVADPTSAETTRLAGDMRETLDDIGGSGLAAPQVHVSQRLIVYRVAAFQIPEGAGMEPIPWTVLVNPVLTPLTEEKKDIWERCLSIPGLHGLVPRHTRVRLDAVDLAAQPVTIDASGFHAMLLQHEYDHLDGILYPMRMSALSTLAFNSELGDKGFIVRRDPAEFSR